MEHRDDDDLLLAVAGTWGGGPITFDELQVMVREGIEASDRGDVFTDDEVGAHIETLMG